MWVLGPANVSPWQPQAVPPCLGSAATPKPWWPVPVSSIPASRLLWDPEQGAPLLCVLVFPPQWEELGWGNSAQSSLVFSSLSASYGRCPVLGSRVPNLMTTAVTVGLWRGETRTLSSIQEGVGSSSSEALGLWHRKRRGREGSAGREQRVQRGNGVDGCVCVRAHACVGVWACAHI